MRPLATAAILGLALTGCAGPARATDSTTADSSAGQKIYVAKCAKCHKFYDPAKYSEEDWAKWMGKMSRKAKLKPEQVEALSKYIDENLRGAQKTASPPAKQGKP